MAEAQSKQETPKEKPTGRKPPVLALCRKRASPRPMSAPIDLAATRRRAYLHRMETAPDLPRIDR